MKIIVANLLIIIELLILFIYGIRKNNNFISILSIFKDHFEIFNGANKHILILYVSPLLMTSGIALKYCFTNSLIEAIMVVISVVISALLSFQGLILNIKKEGSKTIKLLQQTNSSINFVVLINIILVFTMLIYIAVTNDILKMFLTAIISYLMIISFLTILIIMKRVRVILNSEGAEE